MLMLVRRTVMGIGFLFVLLPLLTQAQGTQMVYLPLVEQGTSRLLTPYRFVTTSVRPECNPDPTWPYPNECLGAVNGDGSNYELISYVDANYDYLLLSIAPDGSGLYHSVPYKGSHIWRSYRLPTPPLQTIPDYTYRLIFSADSNTLWFIARDATNTGSVLRQVNTTSGTVIADIPLGSISRNDLDLITVSPDGTFALVFHRASASWMLYRIPLDGSPITTLFTGDSDRDSRNYYTSLSPDGTQIAFIYGSHEATHKSLYLMNADGSSLRPIFNFAPSSGDHFGPVRWSPDGQWLTTRDPRPYSQQIFVMRATGADFRILAASDSYPTPIWTPDGRYLISCGYRAGPVYAVGTWEHLLTSSTACPVGFLQGQ